jgi:hypothetical protein
MAGRQLRQQTIVRASLAVTLPKAIQPLRHLHEPIAGAALAGMSGSSSRKPPNSHFIASRSDGQPSYPRQARRGQESCREEICGCGGQTEAVAAPVVTLIAEQLGETHDLSKKQAHGVLADFVMAVSMHLKRAPGSA